MSGNEAAPPVRRGYGLWLALGVAVVVVGVSLLMNRPRPAPPRPPLAQAPADAVAVGRGLYAQHCAACHGAQLEGQPDWRVRKADGRLPAPPHDDSGHTWHHDDATLIEITRVGLKPPIAPQGYQSDMPAYEKILSEDQIYAVLAFIASRWSPEARAHQMSTNGTRR